MIAWTYDGGIWTNTHGLAASGFTEALIRRYEINDGTRARLASVGITRVWVETTDAAQAQEAARVFGAGLAGFYLPDEPNNRPGGKTWSVAPDEIGRIAKVLREAVPSAKLWLNIVAREDAAQHVAAFAAAAPTNTVLSAGLYLNATADCSYKNTLASVRQGASIVKSLADRYFVSDLGVIAQAFQMTRCGMPKVTGKYLADIVLTARAVFGVRHTLTAWYAWKKDDGFDGQFPMLHPELWPVLKEAIRLINAKPPSPVVPPAPKPDPAELPDITVRVKRGQRVIVEVDEADE